MTANERSKDDGRIKVETFADHQVIRQPNPLKRAVKRIAENADDPVARAEKALEGLSDEFENWMKKECDRLANAHRLIIETGLNTTTQDELFRAAHDIKGDAATFGFPMAAAAADSLCRIMEHAPDSRSAGRPGRASCECDPGDRARAQEARCRQRRRRASKKLRGVADEYLTAVNQDRPEHLEVILGPSIVPGE